MTLFYLVIILLPCLAAAKSNNDFAYDCTQNPTIYKNFTFQSFHKVAMSLKPPHLRHLSQGVLNRYTIGIALNALMTDQIFFLDSILANLTNGEILI